VVVEVGRKEGKKERLVFVVFEWCSKSMVIVFLYGFYTSATYSKLCSTVKDNSCIVKYFSS